MLRCPSHISLQKDEPAVQGLRRASGRIPLWSFYLRGMQVLLRSNVQQYQLNIGMQKQRRMCDQQKKSDSLQSMPLKKVPFGRYVEKWVSLRPPLQLVQDPLPPAGAAAGRRQHGGGG
ncbi:hypothetical protein TcasGA2_TC032367 [Tribolium castaneum]|uniref:Uncharacterized protein n=1 Tax=Tribolium castaneum TaxID=7070 RepID=A0A139WLQ3_TRICA|nr:hypothetical protein TcasGA2_TC032367 [Tribolium castaneum]